MKPSYGSVQNSHFPWNEFYSWGQYCHPQGAHGGTVYLLTWLRCPTSSTMFFKHSILLLSRSEKPRHRSNCWESGNCKSLFASVAFDILREPQKVLKHFSHWGQYSRVLCEWKLGTRLCEKEVVKCIHTEPYVSSQHADCLCIHRWWWIDVCVFVQFGAFGHVLMRVSVFHRSRLGHKCWNFILIFG